MARLLGALAVNSCSLAGRLQHLYAWDSSNEWRTHIGVTIMWRQVSLLLLVVATLATWAVVRPGADSSAASPAPQSGVLPQPPVPPGEAKAAVDDAPQPNQPPTAEQIGQWIRDLESPRLRVRQQATDALIAAGLPALQQVADAARSSKGEAAMRTVRVLAAWAAGRDAALASRARGVLHELTRSEDPDLARRAAEALNQVGAEPEAVPPQAGPNLGAGARKLRVNQRIDAQGHRTTEIDADGTHVTIEELPAVGIKVTVRAVGEADDKAKTYEAKDATELKERHPEAYRWYRDFVERRAPGAWWPFEPGRRGNFPRRLLPPGLAGDHRQALEEIQSAQEKVRAVREALLAVAAEGPANAERLQELVAQLSEALDRLRRAEEALEDAQAFPFPIPPLPPLPQPFEPPMFEPPPLPPIAPPPAPDAS